MNPRRLPVALAVVLLCAAIFLAYRNSLSGPFLLDDKPSIVGNESIRRLWPPAEALAPPPTVLTAGRPVLNLTYALNYAWGGLAVPGYHAGNLLIHLLAALALLGIVRRTLLLPGLNPRYGEAALPLATLVAALWALHPVQTESVTYISQRAESLMGLFYLLTLYTFVRSLTSAAPARWLGLSVAACLAGMATKQVMATAPVLVLLYDRAFASGSFAAALVKRRGYYAGLAATWLLLGFLMHHSSMAAVNQVGFSAGVSWPLYALTELRVVTGYMKLSIWPHPLVFDYGREILVAGPRAVWPHLLVIGLALTAGLLAWRKSPMAGYLAGWFFLILAPTSTVVPIAEQPMAESRLYLPLAAVAVGTTLLAHALGGRRALWALGLVALGFGSLTFRRNHDYGSELRLWEDTVARQPGTSRGHSNLGLVLSDLGRTAEAIAEYGEALRIRPDYLDARNNLGAALAGIHRLDEAIGHFEACLRLKPDYYQARFNLAGALLQLPGRAAEAAAQYRAGLQIQPDDSAARCGLANALAVQPATAAEAVGQYEEALRLSPGLGEAHANLGNLLAKLPGRRTDAIAHYRAALAREPARADVRFNLALALAAEPSGEAEAIRQYGEVLRSSPDFIPAHLNLGNLLLKAGGRPDEAATHYRAVLYLQPDSVVAHYDLALALREIPGRAGEARAHCEQALRLDPDFPPARQLAGELRAAGP